MPPKRFIPPRTRPTALRDARLIVIAAEGQNTEKRYFDDLAVAYHNPHTHVEVLDRLDSASAPEHVLRLLDEFKRKYALRKGYDQLWLVIDVDRWKDRKLSEIAELCAQKGYRLAISNPCFELWLLLHIKSLAEYDETSLDEFRHNEKQGNRSRLELELSQLLGGYNKNDPATWPFLSQVAAAIVEARRVDTHPEHRWTNDLGSRVFLLVEEIL